MSVLVIAEHSNSTLNIITGSVIAAASQLNDDIHVLVAGEQCQAPAEAVSLYQGVSKVLIADNPAYAHQLPEALSPLVTDIARNYSAVIAAASTMGKNFMPRVAAMLDVSQLSDVVAVK